MITVTTNNNELKKFEGSYHNKRELEIAVEESPEEHYGWRYSRGELIVDKRVYRNGKRELVVLGGLKYSGTEIWEW